VRGTYVAHTHARRSYNAGAIGHPVGRNVAINTRVAGGLQPNNSPIPPNPESFEPSSVQGAHAREE
jgi:hypothetical protein